MELEADDGCVVFIPRGCTKELGRGPGIASQDRTVSRRQIALEMEDLGSEDDFTGPFKLKVRVLGPNPVCIAHSQQEGSSLTGKKSAYKVIFLKKGEADVLSVGDKISLSIRSPIFLTVKEGGQRGNCPALHFIERSGSTSGGILLKEGGQCVKGASPSGISLKEETPLHGGIADQAVEDDLMAQWQARKKGKGVKRQDTALTEDEENVHQSQDKEELAAKEEEECIAAAVARRQKRAQERRLQKQQQVQGNDNSFQPALIGTSNPVKPSAQERDVNGSSKEPVGESSIVKLLDDLEPDEIIAATRDIDPVKEFGFLVEGAEFEQYNRSHKMGRTKWHWQSSDTNSDLGEEENVKKSQHTPSSSSKKHSRDEDDEEWIGENQDEKLAIASAKKSKRRTKLSLRSQGTSPSNKAASRRSKAQTHNEDDEDETLGGFIVVDDNNDGNDEEEGMQQDEGLPDEEEEDQDDDDENSDDDLDEDDNGTNDNEDDDLEEEEEEVDKAKVQKQKEKQEDRRPLCKYGKKCYRKNKEHLRDYRH